MEEEVQAGEVAVLLVPKLFFSQIFGYDRLHLQSRGKKDTETGFYMYTVKMNKSNVVMWFPTVGTKHNYG